MTSPLPTSPFAQPPDLEDRWRPLSPAETSRAATLLADAAEVIRAYLPGIDAKLTNGDLSRGAPLMVSCRMVRRAMERQSLGVTQSQTGPFMGQFSNPESNLFILPEEFRLLGRSTNMSPLGTFPAAPIIDPFNRYGTSGPAEPYPNQGFQR